MNNTKKLHTKWFFDQWGDGHEYPTPDIGEVVDQFIQSEKIEPEDLIKIEYKHTESENSREVPFSNFSVFMTYKK